MSESIDTSEILSRVRYLVDDIDIIRWSNSHIYDWLNNGIEEITRERPESQLDDDGNLVPLFVVDASTDIIPLDHDWKEALINYTCWNLFLEDAADESSLIKAEFHENLFKEDVSL